MDFTNTPIEWGAEGTEPSSELKGSGYAAGDKLPANHVNFFVNFLMKAVKEIQNLLGTVATKTELTEGLSGKADSSHTHSQYVTSTVAESTYAHIASPTFTGTPKAPTAAKGTNTTQLATTAFVSTAVEGLAELERGIYSDAKDLTITGYGFAQDSGISGSSINLAIDQTLDENYAYRIVSFACCDELIAKIDDLAGTLWNYTRIDGLIVQDGAANFAKWRDNYAIVWYNTSTNAWTVSAGDIYSRLANIEIAIAKLQAAL